jgi:hypothetical protein
MALKLSVQKILSGIQKNFSEVPDHRTGKNTVYSVHAALNTAPQKIRNFGLKAEQSLRFIVTDRKVCFGTRGMLGIIFCQVMWTAWRTLVKQDKSFYQYLVDCQESHNRSNDIPSLINPGQTVPPEYKELAIEATR